MSPIKPMLIFIVKHILTLPEMVYKESKAHTMRMMQGGKELGAGDAMQLCDYAVEKYGPISKRSEFVITFNVLKDGLCVFTSTVKISHETLFNCMSNMKVLNPTVQIICEEEDGRKAYCPWLREGSFNDILCCVFGMMGHTSVPGPTYIVEDLDIFGTSTEAANTSFLADLMRIEQDGPCLVGVCLSPPSTSGSSSDYEPNEDSEEELYHHRFDDIDSDSDLSAGSGTESTDDYATEEGSTSESEPSILEDIPDLDADKSVE